MVGCSLGITFGAITSKRWFNSCGSFVFMYVLHWPLVAVVQTPTCHPQDKHTRPHIRKLQCPIIFGGRHCGLWSWPYLWRITLKRWFKSFGCLVFDFVLHWPLASAIQTPACHTQGKQMHPHLPKVVFPIVVGRRHWGLWSWHYLWCNHVNEMVQFNWVFVFIYVLHWPLVAAIQMPTCHPPDKHTRPRTPKCNAR